MKRTLCILSVIFFLARGHAPAAEFSDSGSSFSVDFPSGWKSGKSDDPSMVLKLEKGRSFFEFSKLDSELSDYYLKARVKEQADSLRGKGNTISGEVRQASTHGGAAVYYTDYESVDAHVYTAFFTHNGFSYAISASGLPSDEFRGIVSTLRKHGEKIEAPKPRKIRVAHRPRMEETVGYLILEDSVPAAAQPVSVATAAPSHAGQEGMEALAEAELQRAEEEKRAASESAYKTPRSPFITRSPLDFRVWSLLIIIWMSGALWAKGRAGKIPNPKLSAPPKDVPPDFFFPFIISRASTVKEVFYSVLTRQKQRLQAVFNSEHDIYLASAVYACLFFHLFWSLLSYLGRGDIVSGALLSVPGGSLWASIPELIFVAPLVAGIAVYFNQKQVLRMYDSSSNLLMEVKQEASGCLIRDGQGKEVARVVRTGGMSGRAWSFTDTDNQVVFTIKDEQPGLHVFRMLFGNMGGALRSRYGIFASEERRAGFVLLDPSSNDRFQIHLDFAFARLAHPAQILALALYIMSTEKEPLYPWA